MKIDKSQVSVWTRTGEKIEVVDVEMTSDTTGIVTISRNPAVEGVSIGICIDFGAKPSDFDKE